VANLSETRSNPRSRSARLRALERASRGEAQ
jgi:16S rRNA C1402 N4-methylase RsmH